MATTFEIKALSQQKDYSAPDGSEIRLLAEMNAGGLSHCTLPAGKISAAVKHKTVNEIWWCISGKGEIWQGYGPINETKPFQTEESFTIPVGNTFQFKNTGEEPLCILIATIPKWPDPNEAMLVTGHWK